MSSPYSPVDLRPPPALTKALTACTRVCVCVWVCVCVGVCSASLPRSLLHDFAFRTSVSSPLLLPEVPPMPAFALHLSTSSLLHCAHLSVQQDRSAYATPARPPTSSLFLLPLACLAPAPRLSSLRCFLGLRAALPTFAEDSNWFVLFMSTSCPPPPLVHTVRLHCPKLSLCCAVMPCDSPTTTTPPHLNPPPPRPPLTPRIARHFCVAFSVSKSLFSVEREDNAVPSFFLGLPHSFLVSLPASLTRVALRVCVCVCVRWCVAHRAPSRSHVMCRQWKRRRTLGMGTSRPLPPSSVYVLTSCISSFLQPPFFRVFLMTHGQELGYAHVSLLPSLPAWWQRNGNGKRKTKGLREGEVNTQPTYTELTWLHYRACAHAWLPFFSLLLFLLDLRCAGIDVFCVLMVAAFFFCCCLWAPSTPHPRHHL